MKLRRLDLTTLIIFDRLMRLRKATAVAEELGLTAPGISHALRRLREAFGDDLFVRRPHGLDPTAFALGAAPHVARAIEEVRAAFSGPAPFDPRTAQGVLRVGAFDYELSTLMPRVIGAVAAAAPGIRIVARAIGRAQALEALASGELDCAIGYFWSTTDAIIATPLYTESYAVLFRRGDQDGRRMTLPRYLKARHILVSPAGELSGVVDAALAKEGRSRRVIASVPLFSLAFPIVRETGALATVPRRLADAFCGDFGLEAAAPPLAIRAFPVALARSRRNARSPLHNWLDAIIRAVSKAPRKDG